MLSRVVRMQSVLGCNGYAASTFLVAVSNSNRTTTNPGGSIRHAGVHARWQRAYLKDLYHRRVLLGPDPATPRSSQDNWNYPSEISALSHRLHVPEMDHGLIVQALTDHTFFERQTAEESTTMDQQQKQRSIAQFQCNDELIEKGLPRFRHIVLAYLRAHWPQAPEEFIIAVASRIASGPVLTELSQQLGLQHVLRTGASFPPTEHSLHSALIALVGAMDAAKARQFVRCFVLPRLYEVPLEDVLPFRHPFPILEQYMFKLEGVKELEARTISSGGLSTAMPFYEIAIYADKARIVGQSGGERPWVALDLAAQNGLLRVWRVTDEPRVFPFKSEEVYADRFEKAQQPNHRLSEICAESTDLSVYTNEELARDPIDRAEVARQYFTQVRPVVGIPHRRRLRHFFSRGTYSRMSLRALNKPQVHSI